jgi:mono/diheme cytochrome c family protein
MRFFCVILIAVVASGCAAPQVSESGRSASEISRGEYLTGLLGCAACHTQGMLVNAQVGANLAGSDIGIVYTAYRAEVPPGIVFPANITPDDDTGLGLWSREEIIRNVRFGIDRHGRQQLPVMPWPGYAQMTEADAGAISSYLMSLPPVRHEVPENVQEGESSPHRYVRYGIYVFEPDGEVCQISRLGTGTP